MKNAVFWDVAPCRPCVNRRFASIFRVEKSASEEPAWADCCRLAASRISQHFMDPESSLPCSQEASTSTDPEPNQCSPYHPIILTLLSHHIIDPLPVLAPPLLPTRLAFSTDPTPLLSNDFPCGLLSLPPSSI
jgi:hypothetical protein